MKLYLLELYLLALCSVAVAISLYINLNRGWSVRLLTITSNEMPFSWDGLEKSAVCGRDKCFFCHKHNKQIGYLVSRNKREDQFYEHEIYEGYELARYLEKAFDINHFLLGPPMHVTLTNKDTMHLNSNLTDVAPKKTVKPGSMYTKDHMVVVQTVRVAPSQILILKANLDVHGVWELMDGWTESVQDTKIFAVTLERGLQTTLDILMDVPLFANDFQVMIDDAGNLYHFDFDRTFAGIIFAQKFGEELGTHHARAVATVKAAMLWARSQQSSKEQRIDESSDLLTNSELMDQTNAVLMYYQNNTASCDAIQEFVEKNFRWGDQEMTDLARNMVIDYVQKKVLLVGPQMQNCSQGSSSSMYQ